MNLKHNRKLNNIGSLTFEAAVVLPLFIFAMISLLSLMEMIKCYEDAQLNLYKAAKETALYIAGSDVIESISDNIVSDAMFSILSGGYAKSVMDKQLVEDGGSYKVIVGGTSAMSYFHSRVKLRDNGVYINPEPENSDIVDLIVNYQMEPLINVFSVWPYKMLNRCRVHTWTGLSFCARNINSDAERIVYITETGTVYHLSRSCSHISLNIVPINFESVAASRNSEGAKYYRCEICGDLRFENKGVVYITSDGNKYHSSLSCSGLKRTVNEIPISQVGDRKACSRCSVAN